MTTHEINIEFPQLSLYDAQARTLMAKRGIMRPGESIESVFTRVANTLLEVDQELNQGRPDSLFASDVKELIEDKTIAFGTPILANVGREESPTTAACTVLPLPVRQGLLLLEEFKMASQEVLEDAVGTGYDLSDLENPVDSLKQMNGFLNELNASLIARQKRPVASMATLRMDHPKILEFIVAKRNEDFSKWRLNLSVFITEDLFTKSKNHGSIDLVDHEGAVVGQLSAQTLLDTIEDCAHYCGEPGILFRDRFEADNPTPQLKYLSTAPCAEVAMSANEVCQFSYVNLTDLIEESGEKPVADFSKIQKAAQVLTRLLDAATQITIDNDLLGRDKIGAKRRIGVGITGFAGMLINLRIPYDSPEAVLLAKQISELIDFATKKESVSLAGQRGAFPMYKQSRFTDREWVKRKIKKTTGLISIKDWETLFDDISRIGIRHATTTAFPPTGTSSRIVNTTTSFEPALFLTRGMSKKRTSVSQEEMYDFVARSIMRSMGPDFENVLALVAQNGGVVPDFLLRQAGNILAVARQISAHAHMNIQAAFLQFADESGAKTINLPQSTTIEEMHTIFQNAYNLGLKGLTVFRENALEERRIIL